MFTSKLVFELARASSDQSVHLPQVERTWRLWRGCLIALTALASGPVFAALSPEQYHAKVVETYAFEPHTLDKAGLAEKSAALDGFWELTQGDKSRYLPMLRDELKRPESSGFFRYDGAKLLLAQSQDRSDQELALRSLQTVDLRDVQDTDYLITVQRLASNGLDTREAAFHILPKPDFKAYIARHSITLGQNFSLIYMLFPMPESLYVNDLIAKLKSEKDLRTQKTLLEVTWYTETSESRAALKQFAETPGMDEENVKYARELLARRAGPSLTVSSLASLRAERQKLMQRPISDEALTEFDSLTREIAAKQ